MMSDVRAWLASLTPEKRDYVLLHLPSHLSKSNEHKSHKKLYRFLSSFDFIESKIFYPKISIQALIEDYDKALSSIRFNEQVEILKLIQEALQLSAYILDRDNTQLAGQLLGRLMSFQMPDLQVMLDQAKKWHFKPWLRPLNQNLTTPGRSLVRTIYSYDSKAYNSNVIAGRRFVLSPDGKYIVYKHDYINLQEVNFLDWQTGEIAHKIIDHNCKTIIAYVITLDGKSLISVSEDCTLKIWDLRTFKSIYSHSSSHIDIKYHGYDNWKTFVTPDSKYVIFGTIVYTAIKPNQVFIFNLHIREWDDTLKGYNDWSSLLALSPCGKYLIFAHDDFTFRIWNLQEGKCIHTLKGHDGYVSRVIFTTDGRYLISCSGSSTLKIWNWQEGIFLGDFTAEPESFNNFIITTNGQYLISSSKRSLKIWNWHTREFVRTLEGHADLIEALAVTPDDKYLISSSEDQTFKVWDWQKEKSMENVETLNDQTIAEIAVMPDNKYVISISSGLIFNIWDWQKGEIVDTFRIIKNQSNIIFIYINKKIKHAILKLQDKVTCIFELLWEKIQLFDESTARVFYCEHIFIKITEKIADAWQWLSDTIGLEPIPAKYGSNYRSIGDTIAVFPDCNHIVYTPDSFVLQIWNIKTGRRVCSLRRYLHPISAIAVTRDGKYVIWSSYYTINVLDWQGSKLIQTFKCEHSHIVSIKAIPKSRYIICTFQSEGSQIWDIQSGKEVNFSVGGKNLSKFFSIWLTLDEKYVIFETNHPNKELKVWNWREENLVLLDCDTASRLVTSPHSKYLFSTKDKHSTENHFGIYNWQTGEYIANFTGESPFHCHVVLPDMRTFITGDLLGRLHIFQLEGI